MLRIELGAMVALGVAVAGGLIWLGQLSQTVNNLEESVKELKESQTSTAITRLNEDVERLRIDVEDIAGDRFSKFPVGSIIPFVGKRAALESFIRWKICDGSILEGERYRDSPFYNRPLPELDGVFLRATLSDEKLSVTDGSDVHRHVQTHTHSGRTKPGDKINFRRNYDNHEGGGNHEHNFDTGPPSVAATEEGTTIPRHVNVFYIIKVI